MKQQEIITEIKESVCPIYSIEDILNGIFFSKNDISYTEKEVIILNGIIKNSINDLLPFNSVFAKIIIDKLQNLVQVFALPNPIPNKELKGFIKA